MCLRSRLGRNDEIEYEARVARWNDVVGGFCRPRLRGRRVQSPRRYPEPKRHALRRLAGESHGVEDHHIECRYVRYNAVDSVWERNRGRLPAIQYRSDLSKRGRDCAGYLDPT